MNIAVIFAGGTGKRMKTASKPKQFLELRGKPIIIYTLEHFENHELIDGIIVVCVEDWIDYCTELVGKFHISKVKAIIPGGTTGMLSRYNGIRKASELFPEDSIILMHDGVRPLIDHETITKNIESVEKYGSGITVAPAIETIAVRSDSMLVGEIIDRKQCQMAKAPQSFRLGALLAAHQQAIDSGMDDCIDTAYLMQLHGHEIYAVEGPTENIKITTPSDYFTFRALMDLKENPRLLDEEDE
ncbi:MAG: 2-C-methyl-D-erythritol 4-phosphate cytidylyltransferase [Clostridiales bacterium]|nr:2-C-methyl-D-erythritol 4-phosphate cytidylyltransferase [Clostridiales bacterium]